MSIKKQFLKSRPVCKVTFRLPKEEAKEARAINVVGEFNNWDVYATPMKCLKNGAFTTTIDLKQGREYQFRYLIDGTNWENDWNADKYIANSYGNCENSIVAV
jgi:1,4-alpha-glucan branching enzyme